MKREDNAIPWRVHNLRQTLQKFIEKRQVMSVFEQHKAVKAIHAEVKQIYIHAFIESKEDVEQAFQNCYDEMIEIQHHLLMMAMF